MWRYTHEGKNGRYHKHRYRCAHSREQIVSPEPMVVNNDDRHVNLGKRYNFSVRRSWSTALYMIKPEKRILNEWKMARASGSGHCLQARSAPCAKSLSMNVERRHCHWLNETMMGLMRPMPPPTVCDIKSIVNVVDETVVLEGANAASSGTSNNAPPEDA